METLFKVIGGIVIVLVLMILGGLTLSLLWGWFLVPLGLPSITVVEALGISLIAGFLTYNPPKEKGESFTVTLVGSLMKYLAYILYGFVLLQFMPK